MIISKDIPGIDSEVAGIVVGCDPGPTHSAFATVVRYGNRLSLFSARYVSNSDIVYGVLAGHGLPVDDIFTQPFAFSFEKMATRFGAVPGATVFDTCRYSGVIQIAALQSKARAVYGLSTADWRVAFNGFPNSKDSEVRQRILDLFGEDADKIIRAASNDARKKYALPSGVGSHLRDAVGVAAGTYLLKRRGAGLGDRAVWDWRKSPGA